MQVVVVGLKPVEEGHHVGQNYVCQSSSLKAGILELTENKPANQLISTWKPKLSLQRRDAGLRDDHGKNDETNLGCISSKFSG